MGEIYGVCSSFCSFEYCSNPVYRLSEDPDRRIREQTIVILQNITTTNQDIVFVVDNLGNDRLLVLLQKAMGSNDAKGVEQVRYKGPVYPLKTAKSGIPGYSCLDEHFDVGSSSRHPPDLHASHGPLTLPFGPFSPFGPTSSCGMYLRIIGSSTVEASRTPGSRNRSGIKSRHWRT